MDLKGVIDLTYYIYQNTSDEGVSFDCSTLNTPNYKAAVNQLDANRVADTNLDTKCLGLDQNDNLTAAKRVMYAYLQAFLLDEKHTVNDLMLSDYDLADLVDSMAQAEQMWAFEAKVNAQAQHPLNLGLHMTKAEADADLAQYPDDANSVLDQIQHGVALPTPGWDSQYPANVFFDLYHTKVDEEHVLPVMYREFYPTHFRVFAESQADPMRRYIKGLKYNDLDAKPYEHDCFEENHGVTGYMDDFLKLLTYQPGDRFVLVAIPSSKVDKVNVVQKVIAQLAQTYPKQFIDGCALLKRKADGTAAHEGNNGNRDANRHMQAWDQAVTVDADYQELPIIVMDDVLTSGASFDAADLFLSRKLGLPLEHIMNFAYGKTVLRSSLQYWQQESSQSAHSSVKAVILDLDQTLFDTTALRRVVPESSKKSWWEIHEMKNYAPGLFKRLATLSLPYAIVSNNTTRKLEFILTNRSATFDGKTQPVREVKEVGGRIVFSTKPAENNPTFTNFATHPLVVTSEAMKDTTPVEKYDGTVEQQGISRAKPDPVAVNQAIQRLQLPTPDAAILGIGNTIADMQAYRAAGMVTMFVDYGNRVKLPKSVVGADYFAEEPAALLDKIENSTEDLPYPNDLITDQPLPVEKNASTAHDLVPKVWDSRIAREAPITAKEANPSHQVAADFDSTIDWDNVEAPF